MSTGAAELAQVAKDSSVRMQDALPDIRLGKMPKEDIVTLLIDAAAALEKIFVERTRSADFEDDALDAAKVPGDVHAWISATFTRKASIPQNPRRRLRSLVNAVRAGLVFDRIFRRLSLVSEMIVPPNALFFLKDHINDWSFDAFNFHTLCEQHSLKCLGFELLHNLNLVVRYRIDPTVLESFLLRMEEGYSKHGNPYHNQVHATDVLKTCHYFVIKTRMIKWLADLEVFALLLAAIMHDFEHTGTTNNFHIITESPLALTYNDRSVLEQFHISECYRLMQDPDLNILAALTKEEFSEFRSLTVDMIFATDMSAHLSQVQTMKETLVVPENLRKINILSYLLHSADISHPTKSWELHDHWTKDLVEEFFRQGDHERALGLNCSPLCDRHSTMIPQSQIGFINFIVEPCFKVLGDMLSAMEPLITAVEQQNGEEPASEALSFPWMDMMAENKATWAVLAEEAKQKKAKADEEREKAEKEGENSANREEKKEEEEEEVKEK